MKPIMTTAGINVMSGALLTGNTVLLSHIALGDVGWSPDASALELQNERRRITVAQGEHLGNGQIHLSAVESGSEDYWVKEVGFFLEDGTLLAVWSDESHALAYKSQAADLLLGFDLTMLSTYADAIVISGEGGLHLPAATVMKRGTIQLATSEEVNTGASNTKGITPETLHGYTLVYCARKDHDHDYSVLSHLHDERYAALEHSHNYANATHQHDDIYSPLVHSHNYALPSHHHDTDYAALAHHHNALYAALEHSHAYASDTHHHNAAYANIAHQHNYSAPNHQHSVDDITDLKIFDAGTKMVFFQSSAPTGWVKETQHNDKALRVVSGSGGGYGGSTAFSSAFNHSHGHNFSVNNHTLSEAQMPSHNHGITASYHNGWPDGANDRTSNDYLRIGATRSKGSSHAHSHGLGGTVSQVSISPNYVDVIICKKS